MEKASPSQLTRIIQVSKPCIVQLCKEMHGTRSIQKLIDCSTTISDRKLIAEQLDPSIRFLSREINGNQVLVKILQTWGEKQFIFDRLIKECEQIACHKHGCCLMQKGIDAAEG